VNGTQKIVDFESLSSIDAAESGVNASRLELLQDGLDSAYLAIEDLGQIRALENQMELYDIQLRSFQLSDEIMSTGSRLGVSDSNDLLQVRSQIIFLKTEINRLEFELQRRKRVFTAKYGFGPVPLIDIKVPMVSGPVDVDRLPAAIALNQRIDQSRFEKLVYYRRFWPDLSLQASYTSAQSAWPSQLSYPSRFASIAVVADLSALWREKQQREYQDPIIQTRINRLTYLLKNLRVEYEQLDAELALVERQIPLLDNRVEVTQKSKEVSKAKLRLGRLSFLELQQSEQAAYSAAQERYLIAIRKQILNVRKELAMNFDLSKYQKINCPLP
jgi:outer membrane protein TolC